MSDFYLHFTLGLPHLYTMLTLYDCTYVLSQHFFLSSSVIGRITLHGFPTATLSEGISFTTTLPAPITTLLPIVTPGITCTPAPNHTLFPYFNWICIFQTPIPPLEINRMSRCMESAIRSNEHIIPERNSACIKHNQIVICIKVFTCRYTISVIAPKVRFNVNFFSRFSQDLFY